MPRDTIDSPASDRIAKIEITCGVDDDRVTIGAGNPWKTSRRRWATFLIKYRFWFAIYVAGFVILLGIVYVARGRATTDRSMPEVIGI